jgi:TonB family protein
MSVEPRALMSEVWTRWQGHIINGVFPLGRYLGCSDHSGVFLTELAGRRPSEIAIKLVPADRALAESQLPRWKRAGGLTYPHLLRLFEWGGCQLDGLPYLYIVMEYADQTLAQLLLNRTLTADEAREMLPPILDALAFLHGRNLVQGQLKPANILVVGDQLKLASDTIRRASEGKISSYPPTMYDSPEDRHAVSTPASDIRALGLSLFEALTRRSPVGLGESRETVVLPADFSPAFRDVLTRCLHPNAEQRPNVADLLAWAGASSAPSAPATATEPAASLVPPEPGPPEPRVSEPSASEPPSPPTAPAQIAQVAPVQVEPDAAQPAPSRAQPPKPRGLLTVMLWAAVILALIWLGVSLIRSHRTPAPPPGQAPGDSRTSGGASSGASQAGAPDSTPSTAKAVPRDKASPSTLHEVIPQVPPSARRTIHGNIRVWVRATVEQDGSVSAAVADRTGPSRYFERLAVDAARKWRFPPVDTPSRREVQLRFDFSRDGTTGHAVARH